jgi:hypothetical protein
VHISADGGARTADQFDHDCGFKINMAVQRRASLMLTAGAAMGFPEMVL